MQAFALFFLLLATLARAEDFHALCTDRLAVERVYYNHRLGEKPPFEQVTPPSLIERMVSDDQLKEAILKKVYGFEISPAVVEAEVRRIDTTTRAPEMLEEIKQALGSDPGRFARAMARPIVVARELRRRFDHDDALHADQRREAELARGRLLAKQPVEGMQGVTWQLTLRPADGEPVPAPNTQPPQTQSVAKSGTYSVVATTRIAQVLTPPSGEKDAKPYFEDLDPELQQVLRAQLRKPGDVSAVIETPRGFLVYLAKEITTEALTAASLAIPKRSYEEWLAQQPTLKP